MKINLILARSQLVVRIFYWVPTTEPKSMGTNDDNKELRTALTTEVASEFVIQISKGKTRIFRKEVENGPQNRRNGV